MSALLAEVGLHVAATGETWEDAERLAPEADVVVVDLWMPDLDVGALARVRNGAPAATLAVVTALATEDAARHVAAVAVDLLLHKSAPPAETAQAIACHALARTTTAADRGPI
jgi:DNA-binding NarL/FixJ family response regulator